MINTVKCFL